jgi:hypothetical protein
VPTTERAHKGSERESPFEIAKTTPLYPLPERERRAIEESLERHDQEVREGQGIEPAEDESA